MLPNTLMLKGKTGLFGAIESLANLRNSRAFVALTCLLFALSILQYYTVPENGITPFFMGFSAVMLVVAVVELVAVQKRKGIGRYLKWIVGISFIVSAASTTSTMGAAGSIIFVFPMLLSIQYCSVLYSLFISAITIMGTFVPLLLSSHLYNFDLNVIKLVPGSVIEVSSTLEASLAPGMINIPGTKINELLSVYFPIILFVSIIAVMTVGITSAIRKNLLEQYHVFQNTRE